jgi:hypothetical protein
MSKINQREAVYATTKNVLKDAGIDFEDGGKIETVMTEELRIKITGIICEAFKKGEVELKDTPSNREKLESDSKLSSYVSGLVSNWYRKDKRFNGNEKYETKNPGSRAGQGDPQLKALRALHKQFVGVDNAKAKEIQGHIEARVKTIAEEKTKKAVADIDYSVIDDDLLASLGLKKG